MVTTLDSGDPSVGDNTQMMHRKCIAGGVILVAVTTAKGGDWRGPILCQEPTAFQMYVHNRNSFLYFDKFVEIRY